MDEQKRTPGQAEGTEDDIQNALDKDQQRRGARAAGLQQREHERLKKESGSTPGQAEGTEEQAEGSLRKPK